MENDIVVNLKGDEVDYITVKVGKLPGRIEEISLNGDRTVQAALDAAGLSAEDLEIRVNGDSADYNDEVDDGDHILLVKKIKGN